MTGAKYEAVSGRAPAQGAYPRTGWGRRGGRGRRSGRRPKAGHTKHHVRACGHHRTMSAPAATSVIIKHNHSRAHTHKVGPSAAAPAAATQRAAPVGLNPPGLVSPALDSRGGPWLLKIRSTWIRVDLDSGRPDSWKI